MARVSALASSAHWPRYSDACSLVSPPGGELQETVCGASAWWGWRQAVHGGAPGAGTARSAAPGPSPELLFL